MKTSPFVISILLAALLALASCTSLNQPAKFPPRSVSHVVICYLKNRGNPIERQKLIDATRDLASIPGILDMSMGQAVPSTRPVVVSDFDVALIITFRDEAALRAYESNPKHLQAVKEVLQPLVAKLVIYDIMNQ